MKMYQPTYSQLTNSSNHNSEEDFKSTKFHGFAKIWQFNFQAALIRPLKYSW